jgi:DNA-binding NarL/FixJ family response regulator
MLLRAPEPTGTTVLLIADDGPTGLSLLRAMEAVAIEVEWARSVPELKSRAARTDLGAPEVVFLDLELAEAAAEQLVPLVRETFPRAAVVALAGELSGESAARLLGQGVPSLGKPVSPLALAGLALRLSLDARLPLSWRPGGRPDGGDRGADHHDDRRGAHLDSLFSTYSAERVLSKQQRQILRLYLNGMNDKEIAQLCRCSEATVYEHWRRMARKAGGSQKGDVIADFHRFLGGD